MNMMAILAKKGSLARGKGKTKNKDEIDNITKDIKLIQKYRNRIKIIVVRPVGLAGLASF